VEAVAVEERPQQARPCGSASGEREQNPRYRGLRPFQPGQSGNPKGRERGSRNKLGEAFVDALHEDFQEHGPAAITACREENPAAYLKVVASLLPKELNIRASADLTDEQLEQRIRQLASALGIESEPAGAPRVIEGKAEAVRPDEAVPSLP
jgi:hypothetical protein